jgi:hypothetical protein
VLKIDGAKIADTAKKAVTELSKQARRQNASLDTNIVTIYNGTNNRQFSFDFTIIPVDLDHSDAIIDGILSLKKNMTGKRDAGQLTVVQRNVFKLEFKNVVPGISAGEEDTSDYLMRLLGITNNMEFNLTDINISYGSGNLTFYRDGMPKSLNISLTFVERKPLYYVKNS